MDLTLSADQRDLRAALREYLAGAWTPERLRSATADSVLDRKGWRELAEMGVYPFVVPFRPHPGTLAVDVDGAQAPDAATVEKVSREVAAALRLAGMAGVDQKAGCAACGACGVLQSVGG